MFQKLLSLFHRKADPGDPRALFAAEAETLVRAQPEVAEASTDLKDYSISVTLKAGGSLRLNLDNAFAETREKSPGERRAHLGRMLSALRASKSDPWEEARERIVPVVRATTYGIEVWSQDPAAEFVRRPFLPFLDQFYAVDHPHAMSYVGRKHLEDWGVGEDGLQAAAAGQFEALADAKVEKYDDKDGPLWTVGADDDYEASRLLLPGWLASFRAKVEGAPVAIVPTRSTVMVGGDARPELVERLLESAEREYAASNRRISQALYTVDASGAVVPYWRVGSDPLAKRVALAHHRLALDEYGIQKAALDALYEARGHDVFVASFQVYDTPAGIRSLAIWSKGVLTYLPRAEWIVLSELTEGDKPTLKRSAEVPFAAVEPYLKRLPGLHPERWETQDFPEHLLAGVPP